VIPVDYAVSDLVARLTGHRTIGSAPEGDLVWVARHGHVRTYAAGERIAAAGEPLDGLNVVLSGRVSIRVNRGAGPRTVMEWRAGDVTGVLPYSRLLESPGDVRAEEPTELLVVPRGDLEEMARTCHALTAILVHVMLDRARHFTSADLLDEKMLALGKLSAGLAHELNNPASALVRSAKELTERLADVEAASRAMGAAPLGSAERQAIEMVRRDCAAGAPTVIRSPLEQADHEDAIAAWLRRHGADTASAGALAESAVTFGMLDDLAAAVDGPALDVVLRWMAADCVTRKLASEIESAAARIHTLVAAVKGFTHMDHAGVPARVDLRKGLTDTLAVLAAKARAKSVGVTMDIPADLPHVEGFGGELNQVWANLLDNALDAVGPSGRVDVAASAQGGAVVVRIVDNGPGIPANLLERIFEPFFTTKPVGRGTGLGLEIARRLVRRHEGEIAVESAPGRTEFRVTLPVASQGTR
jgi:signal transduction histidine kinase